MDTKNKNDNRAYLILQEDSLEQLEILVNRYICQGWKTSGHLHTTIHNGSNLFLQPVLNPKRVEELTKFSHLYSKKEGNLPSLPVLTDVIHFGINQPS